MSTLLSLRQLFAVAAGLWAVIPVWAASSHTGNQYAVSESGAATLTVPIQVPRGIGGMEPQLALSYSSGSGNGLLGIGWTLSGPSAVTRCPKSMALDGVRGVVKFTAEDRFCLDGQRLVLVAGTYGASSSEYRTERDSFSRITVVGQFATNVPNSFKVETKAGLILEFGLSANSQVPTNIAAGLGTNTINRWMLQRISDRHGSFVEFVYCAGEVANDGTCTPGTPWSGSTVLHYVRYTNRGGAVNGEFAVMLGYQGRPDGVQGFHMGSASRQTQRIYRVETYRDFTGPQTAQRGTLVRRYDISYDPIADANGTSTRATNVSRIRQIQESGADGAALPALRFTSASDAVFEKAVLLQSTGQVGTPQPDPCGGVIVGIRRLQCR